MQKNLTFSLGLGPFLFLARARVAAQSGSGTFGMDSSPLWYCVYSNPRPGASRESVMVGNRNRVVEGHHSLTTCFTNLPNITARYITSP